MNPSTCVPLAALVSLLGLPASSSNGQVLLDGILSPEDNYSDVAVVTFFNGHDNTTYGDFNSQYYNTHVWYGTGTLVGDSSETEYFFLLAEAPVEIKTMVWGSGMTAEEISEYGKELSFSGATGSEELNLLDFEGSETLTVNLANGPLGSGKNDAATGFIEFRDSVDYLLGNGLATEDSSDNSNVSMSYEIMFQSDPLLNQQVIDNLQYGIDFHLSPDRGLIPDLLVPEPSSLALLGLGGLALLCRRRGV